MRSLAEILGDSPKIVALREQVARLLERQKGSQRLAPVLIQGETGTGKGLLAHAMHRLSSRANGPFVPVNCAAIPETLLEAEMFGFERGAFTDARQAKPGLFQAAHRGTIFLDEIALLPEGLQSKLLKAIEEREVRRLGSTRSEHVDIWIIAAGSQDLASARRERHFHEALYHRLSVVTLSLPPLRERGDDILLLARHFLETVCHDYGVAAKSFADDIEGALQAYPWPGNVRELANVIERAVLLSDASVVSVASLGLEENGTSRARPDADGGDRTTLLDAMGMVERDRIMAALRKTNGNVSRAAALLGIPRNTLDYRIAKHGLRGGDRTSSARPRTKRQGPGAGAPAPASEPAPSGRVPWERRQLALLKVVMKEPGVSETSAAVDMLDEMVEKVRAFGGRLEEASATVFVATFGIDPVEDAAARAAHAAIAIQKAARHAQLAPETEFAVTAAVHCDRLTIGRRSDGWRIALEDKRAAVALLDALVDGAAPRDIIVSAGAATLLERRFELTPGPEVGGAPTHRLVGHDKPRFRLGGHVTRYVGRRSERDVLEARLKQAAVGHGQVVAVAGEAGIGKSRLVFEFRHEIDPENLEWLEGRCVPHGTAVAYLPLLDVIRGVCGITEDDGLRTIAAKVHARVAALGMDPGDVTAVVLNLLSLREGVEALRGLSPDAIKTRTFDALQEMLGRVSRTRPTVIVIEDLHWIDRVSEEFLAALIEGVTAHPMLLVLTYRAGYQPPWITKSFVTQISLQSLSPDESLEIARAVLDRDTVSDTLASLVVTRGDGNPFFIEELAWAVTRAPKPLDLPGVPDTVEGILASRMEHLGTRDKGLLRAAAVIGRDFAGKLLEATDGGAPAEIAAALTRLQHAEFIHAVSRGADPRYAFRHALTHEVAYQSLPPDECRMLHARVAAAIESGDVERREEHVEALAYHAFRGEVWDKAAGYLRRAGERAFQRSANQEAVAFFEQAIEACDRAPDRRDIAETAIDLRILLQLALFALGEHARIRGPLLEAQRRAEALGDRLRQVRVAICLASNSYVTANYAEVLRAARAGFAIAEACGDRDAQIGLLMRCGFAYHARAEFAESVASLRQSLELLGADSSYEHKLLNALPSVHARTWLAWSLADSGDVDAAIACAEQARETADRQAHPYSQVMARWCVGYCRLIAGDTGAAIPDLEASLELCRTSNNTHWSARVASSLGYAYARDGRTAEGVTLIEQGTSRADHIGLLSCSSLFWTWLGEVYASAGRERDAIEILGCALERARRQGERLYEAYALRRLAEIERNETDAAVVVRLCERFGFLSRVARGLLGLSSLARM